MIVPSPDRLRTRLRVSRGALAHSVSAAAWRGALEVRRADPTTAVALRVGLAVLIVLVAGGLSGQTEVAGFAALGALASAFLRYEPYPRLAHRLAGVAGLIVASTAFGAMLGVTGAGIWVQVVAVSAAAALVYWLVQVAGITGPGPVVMIFAATGAAGYADTAVAAGHAVAAAAAGGLVGWLVAMAPMLTHPHSPSRIAVARALAAVAEVEQLGADAVPAARAAIDRARDALADTPSRRVDRHVLELLALVDAAKATLDGRRADTAALDDFARLEAELRRVRSDIGTPRVDAAAAGLPASRGRETRKRTTDRRLWSGATRVGVASLVAGGLASACGLSHPLWAILGAVATLQGVNYSHTVQRGIQRLLGNAAGAVLAAAFLAVDPGYWPLAIAAVACQTGAELTVTRNYAAATTFVTGTALLLTAIGNPVGADVAAARVGDTLIGVVIGVALAALTVRADD
ncbi:FUSC family protein [Gordonia paraffinivorans]|uniref:FUSC family protein n=1 Tax=Gordonia paraffinivorans TaxID=175628 RepID=UPI001E2F7F4C|nr:FUSC family protein [Gordonia paraffinivorans]MCD2145051.1 FUSC family protein [Gordonia paraffinivorans]